MLQFIYEMTYQSTITFLHRRRTLKLCVLINIIHMYHDILCDSVIYTIKLKRQLGQRHKYS